MAENSVAMTTRITMNKTDELRIIQTARQDPKVFGELYKIYVEPVYRYLYSRIGSVPEAEDVTAQTFLAAFESFENFIRDEHFASWLFGIARNKAMDHFRQRKKNSSIDDFENIQAKDDPISSVIQAEQADSLTRLIQILPEEDRELLRLRFLAEMSFPEIAHFLQRNEDAVKKSIYRLLARLQSQLEVSND
jgi:RNA polymerase sigma-70 factor, ECF subfamily